MASNETMLERVRGALGSPRTTLGFLTAWLLLNLMVNLRYPASEPALWYLVPAIDVVVVFAYFALFAQLGWRVHKAVRVALVGWLFLVRLLRVGDGIEYRYFGQRFSLVSDLRLVPELVRFAYSTLPWWQLASLAVAVPALLGLLALACYRALAHAERFLSVQRHLPGVGAVVGVFLCLSVLPHDPHHKELYLGAFGASTISRLKHEARLLLGVYGYRSAVVREIEDSQALLARTPSNLAKLGGRDVFLFLIESYGATVNERADFARRVQPVYDAFESELGRRGFSLASGLMDSPTTGGRSWLAHSTLATAVRVNDQLRYELILAKKPKPLARFFRDAGYRTVLASPGTTRPWPKGEMFAFDHSYFLWNFEYAGPSYAWATMPDQYVVDFVRRHELVTRSAPLFIQYVLVSSHAPWSKLPSLVDDWDSIQNGALYNELKTSEFPVEWPNFENASEAYLQSILYDLELLRRYLDAFVASDALIIVLGDHQPVPEVAGVGASVSVPVHVLSRDPKLVAPFIARGYTPGMRPAKHAPHPPMERFLPSFLRDFSSVR